MKSVRLGLVGYGFHGGTIARAAQRSTRVRIVAVSDPDGGKHSKIRKAGAKPYEHLEGLLSHPSLQGIIVASPVATHLEVVRQVVRRRLPIEIEKPIEFTYSRSRSVAALAHNAGVPLMVGLTTHYRPEMVEADRVARSGVIGTIRSLHEEIVMGLDPFPRNYVAKDNQGGVLLENGIHMFDHLLWFGGPIRRLLASTIGRRFLRGFHEDTAMVQAIHQNGVVSQGHLQWMPYREAGGFCFKIYGTRGMIEVRGLEGIRVNAAGKSTSRRCYPGKGDFIEDFAARHLPGVTGQLEDFADYVQKGRAPKVTVDHALAAHRWLDEAYKLGRRGNRLNKVSRRMGYSGEV